MGAEKERQIGSGRRWILICTDPEDSECSKDKFQRMGCAEVSEEAWSTDCLENVTISFVCIVLL